MNHCFLKEQYILLLKFLWVSLIFFQIKRNIKKMKSQKKKKNENKKFSELNQCQCQTMSVSDKVRI